MKTLRLYVAALAVLGCSKSQPAAVPEPTEGIAIAPAAPASPWRTPVYPRATWEKVPNPELAGYRSSALDSLTSYLKTIPTTGLVVTVHGRVLYSYGDLLEESYLASARKSVLSMLYGNYVTQGRIKLELDPRRTGDRRPAAAHGRREAGDGEGPAHDELRHLSRGLESGRQPR